MKRLALFAALLATTAHADTWSEATDDEQAKQADYEQAMADGDEQALLAASESTSNSRLKKLILKAVEDYERAAIARPDQAEPHWRAANILHGFFLDCDVGMPLCLGDTVDASIYKRIFDHWNALEKIDPLDPRLTDILFERAIMHTRMATDDDLRAATVDYETFLDRENHTSNLGHNDYVVVGNLAESYMMIGELDKAIARYHEALDIAAETSLYYGLAVAYDRSGEGAKAREIIASIGEDAWKTWQDDVLRGNTFYVPEGEVYYYVALTNEALGHDEDAMAAWQNFIDSGAHPIFDDRARENLKALRAKAAAKTKP